MVLRAWRLPSLVRVPASPVPRCPRYYEGATTSRPRMPGRSLVSLPGPPSPFLASCLAIGAPGGRKGIRRARVLCSAGDASSGSSSRGRERDLIGSQAIHPAPLPRFQTPAGPTTPRRGGVAGAAPAPFATKAPAICRFRGHLAGLRYPLPTLHEWRCRHPCKARFRLADWPLPGGSRTLWTAVKGFSSHGHPPFLGFSYR
jgi:hypothetical protein